ncbi:MAG: AAA family ATPase [Crocinitomicaceae bacterium]|nr:AAA family ATPase [Crocinitomicaceae bacterium]
MALIYLIGFMGCGKSTLGKKVANKIHYEFIDLDQLIEERTSSSISDIFQKKGEEFFRVLEHQIIVEISKAKNTIIALGGGTPCYFNNLEIINETGVSLYLERPAKELYQRIKNAKDTRPLVRSKSDEELLEFIEKLLTERSFHYQRSTYTVPRNYLTSKGLTNYILEHVAI